MVRPTQLTHPQRAPARLLSAATVLLLRDGPNGLEVLMTRRAMSASFAPGAYVFPGGGIDATDAQAHAQARRRTTQPDAHLTQAIAAIREIPAGKIIEEADLCMLSPGDGFKWAQRNMVVGKRTTASIPANEIIYPIHLED